MVEAQPLPSGVLRFPEGLPGFENLTQFVLLQDEDLVPLAFLASLVEPRVCLPVLPVRRLDTDYDLRLDEDDRRVLHLTGEGDLLCLAIVTLGDGAAPPTANLLAPIVVNLSNWTAKQVIQIHSSYSPALEIA